jgi:hypothetical protein
MTEIPVIGVVGATGEVGAEMVCALAAGNVGRLRLGARKPDALQPVLTALDAPADVLEVDLEEPASLARFVAGCRLVINCVGPLVQSRAALAGAAWAGGSDYLDTGGDEWLFRRLAADLPAGTGRVAVLGAGLMPGLTSLLPRWLAGRGLAPPLRLTGYVASADRTTPAAAAQLLLSLADGESNASWLEGTRATGDLKPLQGLELPFFPGAVTAHPHLSVEIERVARSVGLMEARWYHVFPAEGQMLPMLIQLQRELRDGGALPDLAQRLSQAAAVDMSGRTAARGLVVEISGDRNTRAAVLHATRSYLLTAAVASMAAVELIAERVPAGLYFAGEVLEPGLVSTLPGRPGVLGLHLVDGPLSALAEAEVGAM